MAKHMNMVGALGPPRPLNPALLDCTSSQHKDQSLLLYLANQHGLPLETVMLREPVLKSESHHTTTCV